MSPPTVAGDRAPIDRDYSGGGTDGRRSGPTGGVGVTTGVPVIAGAS